MKVGFIGLGIMGHAMASNLLDSNYDLVVYNRTVDKAMSLKAKGAEVADSPAEVADKVDCLLTMLADPNAVEQTALGKKGFLDHLPQNAFWIDCSTVNPSFTDKMAEEAQSRSLTFLDAPVAGSKVPAEKGELVFLVGGEASALNDIRPMLETMGKAINHVGATGMGTSMKMVVNLLLGQSMIAFSEAMNLGESLGIDQQKLLQTLVGGPVTAPFIHGKKENFEQGEYEPEFPLQWMHKDLYLVAQTAYEAGVPLLSTNITKESFARAKQAGYGHKDFSAIYAHLKNLEKSSQG